MVFGFVKQSHGHVKIYSEVGLGTTVKIYLPRTGKSPEAYPASQQAADEKLATETILVVEDDDLVRGHVVQLLTGLGYRVLYAANGTDALRVIEQHRIDLLFTDVVMPGINGRQLADKVRQLDPATKVIFTSGYTENAIVHHGRLDEGVHLLNKPFRRMDLARKVRAVLSGKL